MKRRIVIFITILLSILPIVSCSSISNLIPKALANDTQDIVEQVEANTDEVFAEIQKNIDLVVALKAKVENAKIQGQPLSLDDVIKDIHTVSDSYDKLSGQHEAITRGLLKKITNIENMQKRVDTEIKTLQQRRTDYSKQLVMVSDPNPDIVRTRQESLTQAIKYVERQIQLWVQFNSIEADIATEMGNVQKSIDSFLSVIDSSALVYREGLNLLLLQKNINDALSLFNQDLPRIEQLTADMERSWFNLDYLIQTLTSVSTVEIPKH